MQRGSYRASDEVSWDVVGIQPGAVGLDTRADGLPGSLSKLKNARFEGVASLERRHGYTGQTVQDGTPFPASSFFTQLTYPGTPWIYGHGLIADGYNTEPTPPYIPDTHVPVAGRGGGAFEFGDSEVVWTGDRLYVMRDGTAVGSSAHWTGTTENMGIPAMLPVQTNVDTPEALASVYAATCLTTRYRIVASASNTALVAWVIDRSTGAIVSRTELASALAKDLRAVNSGDVPVLLWREASELRMSHWSSASGWSTVEGVDSPVTNFAIAQTPLGFHLAVMTATGFTLTEFVGSLAVSTHYPPRTTVTPTVAPGKHLAMAVDPSDNLYLVYVSIGSGGFYNDLRLMQVTDGLRVLERSVNLGTTFAAVTATARGLRHEGTSTWPVVIYAESDGRIRIFEYEPSGSMIRTGERYNSKLASHAWTVGNEPMVWLRSELSGLHYLLAGVTAPAVIGYADREEAATRVTNDGEQALQYVNPDPSGTHLYTWVSLWDVGTATIGNLRVGDINFLPPLVTARFGESVYLAGSAVRNWDGYALGDAGFQDVPRLTSGSVQAGGALSTGQYRYRVYAVTYNARGEKFTSAARTSQAFTAAATNKIVVTIETIPSANSQVTYEVYRTEADGSAYYLEGTVANNLAAPTVTFQSMMADADLVSKPVDPRAPGVGISAELEEFGPIGCSILATAADRLWGAGGQVPAGTVQYSKLKEAGEGAGFDALGGTFVLDLEGRPVTSIAAVANGVVIFQRHQIHTLGGTGPDNLGAGTFAAPELRLADGAITHLGTGSIQAGVVYWGVDGPRLLDHSYRVQDISLPVHSITSQMTPVAVAIDLARHEVTWYGDDGVAIHCNYQSDRARWAEWRTPVIAGGGSRVLVTPGGVVLRPAYGADDNGAPFEFMGRTSEIIGDKTLEGRTLIGSVGVAGEYQGPHNLRLRVYYNGSPSWIDEWIWQPATGTWLQSSNDLAALTPSQVDALLLIDQSGGYAVNRRVSVPQSRLCEIEWSDVSSHGQTLLLREITCELGARPGYGRTHVGTFGG